MAALPASHTPKPSLPAQVQKNPLSISILGASGDLARKKTYPALFSLFCQGLLPQDFTVVGYARSQLPLADFHRQISEHFKAGTAEQRRDFLKRCQYVSGGYDSPDAYEKLQRTLTAAEKGSPSANRLFYLALPPELFVPASKHIQKTCRAPTGGFNRVVVEKPFGSDLASARKLGDDLQRLVPESELYRIDHYLGKDMVQNLLTSRFSNSLLERCWDRKSIESVVITCKETIGTEGRGGYFDGSGILRDITQNHLMQIFSLVAMERPKTLSPEHIRDAKVDVLRRTSDAIPSRTVLGQYEASGGKMGYRDDPTVPKDSKTPTYAATTLFVDNDRWRGVPFVLKAGKALNNKKVDVRLNFRSPANTLYGSAPPGELVFRVQPDEAIYYKFNSKTPGLSQNFHQTELDLQYNSRYSNLKMPDAYEALMFDAICGRQNNFVRQDELEAAWKIFTPLLHKIDKGELKPLPYPRGSRGPPDADKMVGYMAPRSQTGYKWPMYDADALRKLPPAPSLESVPMNPSYSKAQQQAAATKADPAPDHLAPRTA